MKSIDKSAPVLVTGASGYVAGWLVKRLLDEGLTVHAAVRDPSQTDKLQHLDEAAANSPGEIQYFKADLLEAGSYAEAMHGCQLVYHTASPFTVNVTDPQRELVDPAVLGTRNVLEQANQTDSVRRVVLTSSCAAIYGDNADVEQTPSGVFTEDVWNTSSSLKHQPYSYSKTMAEREAWRVAEAQSRWDLVTINPSLVIGPGLNPHATSESFNIIRQIGDGTMKTGVPHWGIGAVDVRDVAEAHYRAGFTSEAKGRYIISAHETDFAEMASVLQERFGRYPIPRRILPKWLVWLVGPVINPSMTRKMVARNVNLAWRCDNRKAITELGLNYRPLKDSMEEWFQQLVDNHLLPSPGGSTSQASS